jgi:uncharacterized membrane protein
LEITETGEVFKDTLTSGSMGGFAADTVTVATSVDFTKGTYTFKAYFSSLFDIDRQNDTLLTSFVVNPALSVRIRPQSDGTSNCLQGNIESNPEIVITNIGNLPLSDIGLKVSVLVNSVDIVDSISGTYSATDILPGDSVVHTFTTGYTVPWEQYYLLVAEAYLQCNLGLIDTVGTVPECVNVVDIRVDSLIHPTGNQPDVTGSQVNITVSLKNTDPVKDYQDMVKITVIIHNSKNEEVANYYELLPLIHNASDTSYTFTAPYTVPNDTAYSITVFITDANNQYLDQYHYNDTLHVVRTTNYIGIQETGNTRISMSQNIPNPVTNTTRIDYSLPTDGEVTFHVYTISGQELINQVVETTSGKHSIELNTTHLASGIYFYSMEFKGQRIVKRMSVAL